MHIITQFLNTELHKNVFFFVWISTVVSCHPHGRVSESERNLWR